jgi:hypothetical protein
VSKQRKKFHDEVKKSVEDNLTPQEIQLQVNKEVEPNP